MTGQDLWNDWAADWRADGAETPDFEAVERTLRRRRRNRLAQRTVDLLGCLVGIGISGWAIWLATPAGVIVGLAGLAFSLFGLALALGGPLVPRSPDARTVAGALLFLLVCLLVYQQAGIVAARPSTVVMLGGGALVAVASGAASLLLLGRRRARLRTLEALLAELEDEP